MIAITFALPAESSDLARTIERDEVAIVHTGVGPETAARRIDIFLSETKPRFVISSGFAGGLHEELSVGDVILAENYSDRDLFGRARDLLENHNVRAAQLFTAKAIADTAEERTNLRQTHAADAVDMETQAIASACAARSIPMISLRAITDTPTQPLPAPPGVLFDIQRQRTSFVRLAGHLLAHPQTIPRLMTFSRNVAFARAELTSALLTLLREQHLLYEGRE